MDTGPSELAPPGWRLDELARAGRENLDPGHVALYDAKEDARADDEVALLAAWGLDEGSTVVDLGAGTGQFALAAATVCRRVIAVDVSPVMLARLHAKVAAAGLTNVDVVEAGFLTYEHPGQPADVVYSRWALHHLPDFWKAQALVRMRAFLAVGGILRLSDIAFSFGPAEAEERIEQWCATLPDEAVADGEWTRADIEEHVRDEYSTYTWLLEPMIERAGFRIERADHSGDGILAAYIARAI